MIHNHLITAFRNQEGLRKQLHDLLVSPVLKTALDAIRMAGVPRKLPNLDTRNHPDTIVSHDYHRLVGINEVLDTLEGMTKAPGFAPSEMEEETPFEHAIAPDLQLTPERIELLKKNLR